MKKGPGIVILSFVTILLLPASYGSRESGWVTLTEATFDRGEAGGVLVYEREPDIAWSVVNEAGRFAGITRDSVWHPHTDIELPVCDDGRGRIEISGEFKIVRNTGSLLVVLAEKRDEGGGLCLYFSSGGGRGCYYIQTHWLKASQPETSITPLWRAGTLFRALGMKEKFFIG